MGKAWPSISWLSSRTSPLERFSGTWNLTLRKLGSSSSLQIVIGNSQSFTSTLIQLFDNTFHILQPTYSFLVNSSVKRALKIVSSLPPALYQLNPGLIGVCQSILACNIGKQAPFYMFTARTYISGLASRTALVLVTACKKSVYSITSKS